jgi:hypothetical protein
VSVRFEDLKPGCVCRFYVDWGILSHVGLFHSHFAAFYFSDKYLLLETIEAAAIHGVEVQMPSIHQGLLTNFRKE